MNSIGFEIKYNNSIWDYATPEIAIPGDALDIGKATPAMKCLLFCSSSTLLHHIIPKVPNRSITLDTPIPKTWFQLLFQYPLRTKISK